MAADDATCPRCGRPLVGKDRFERLCAQCREAEVLGEARRDHAASQAATEVVCPACGAANPSTMATCSACHAPLRPAGRRLRVVGLVAVGGAVVAAALLVAFRQRARSRRPRGARRIPHTARAGATRLTPATAATAGTATTATPTAPPPAPPRIPPNVREETGELLELLRANDYERILDNYCQADKTDFERAKRALHEIIEGQSAAGFRRWSRLLIRLGAQEARASLRRAGDPYPAYTVALLSHLARDPKASSPHVPADERTRDVLQWHIAGLFEGLDLAKAKAGRAVRRADGDVVVAVECSGKPTAARPGDPPRQLRWRALPVGLVLKLALADRLETLRGVLDRPVPGPATAPKENRP